MEKFIIKYSNSINSLLTKITTPFYRELPFIFFFMLFMGVIEALQNIHGRLVNIDAPDTYPTYYSLIGKICLWFLFAYIGSCIITTSKRTITKILFYIAIILLYALQHFLNYNFNLKISPMCLVLLAETTKQESQEFINQYIFSDTLFPTLKNVSIYIFSILLTELVWKRYVKNRSIQNILQKGIAFIIIPFLFWGLSYAKIYYNIYKAPTSDAIRFMEPPNDPFSSIFTSYVTVRMMEKNVETAISTTKQLKRAQITEQIKKDSLNIIVVVGESYIKWHSQLYGYRLKTNPYLVKENEKNRLFIFNDVITSSNYTSVVMKNLFSCNNSSDNELWYNFPFFPAIFQQSGYNVYYWDNQLNCDSNATYTFNLNSYFYNSDIIKMSYTKTNHKTYNFDGELILSYKNRIGIPQNKHNLILFHLMGQHQWASARYPHSEFKHFNADSIVNPQLPTLHKKEKEYIADYDNATLYNDYVIKQIIDIFKHTNSILVYLSDHGEEIYDYRMQCSRDHGPLTANKLKYQYDIPFIIWCSDIYQKKYPENIIKISQSTNRPFIIDNLCNLLFDIGGIETPYYRDSLNLLSPNYHCSQRMINGQVYEKIRYNH